MLFPKRMYTNGYQQLLEVLTENEIKLKKKKSQGHWHLPTISVT